MKNFIIRYLPFVLILGVCSASAQNQKKEKPMNVIYILADDLGYGDVGAYGQEKIQTPQIDKMANEGLKFTQHYAGNTVCAPSRASLMTGKHTGHTKIRGNQEVKPEGQMPMDTQALTLGKLMKNAGYTTGIFGKWGLGYPNSEATPNKMGFDEFYGYNCQRQAHSYYPDHLWNNEKRVDFPENKEGKNTYSQDEIHKQAMKFIREHKDQPFFAMLTYTLPHAELKVPKDSIFAIYDGKFDDTPYDGKRGYSAEEQPRATFAAMVTRLDSYVGDIMKELKELGIADNTILIFTSDNGPHREGGAQPDYFKSYGPLRGIKRDLYEGGIRVPMIIWSPKKVKAGTQTDHISAFWDMMPTLAELTHQSIPENTDGISFLPTIFGKENQKKHDYLYWEFHELGGRKALRQGDWKIVVQPINGDTKVELFNLKDDIHEDHDLALKYPKKTEELLILMEKARTESDTFNFGKKK